MTLTELSNIFNTITQNIPGLNFYHFGFLSDINTAIQNNFQPSFDCSDPYPLVMFEPPAGSYRTHDSKIFRTVRLLFADRQDSNKNGTTCDTLAEKMSDLESIALSFMRTLYSLKIEGACLQSSLRKQEATFNLDAYAFNDRLVTYELAFTLVTPYSTDCLDLDITTIDPEDIENVKCDTFLNEYSISYNGIDQYIQVPDNNLLSFGDGATDTGMSISIWIKRQGTGVTAFLLNKGTDAGGGMAANSEYRLSLNSAGFLFFSIFSNLTNNNYILGSSTIAVPGNTWVHIGLTWDGSSMKYYLNGVLQAFNVSEVGTYVAMQNGPGSLTIGKPWDDRFYYSGFTDELTMFNTALNESEILELYNGGQPNDVTTHSKAAFIVYGNRFGDGATFDKNWDFPDISGNGIASNSVNMEEINRTTDIPTV